METTDFASSAGVHFNPKQFENRPGALEMSPTISPAFLEEFKNRGSSQESITTTTNQAYGPYSVPTEPSEEPDVPVSREEVAQFLIEMGYGLLPPQPEPALIPTENSYSHLDDPAPANDENETDSPYSSGPEYPAYYSHPHSNNLEIRIPKTHPSPPRRTEPSFPTSVATKSYFFCDTEGCSGRYRRRRNLHAHKLKIHGETYLGFSDEEFESTIDSVLDANRKYYSCTVVGCSVVFTELRNLWAHQDKYHSHETFFCRWVRCAERSTDFGTMEAFLRHVVESHHDKRYVCEVCGQYGSDRKDNMDRHSSRKHPEIALMRGKPGRVPGSGEGEMVEEEEG